jgi:hypothetical protein
METCGCTYNHYCVTARALRTREDMAYQRYIAKFSQGKWLEYSLAASLRREHRNQALEVFR